MPIPAADRCQVTVESDTEKGGWLVRCSRHGRITSRIDRDDAETSARSHRAKWGWRGR